MSGGLIIITSSSAVAETARRMLKYSKLMIGGVGLNSTGDFKGVSHFEAKF